nr:MAG TPA_asm: hypothetical protein [Bacteriophage sp.]
MLFTIRVVLVVVGLKQTVVQVLVINYLGLLV